jgi:hypothetical protein
VAAKAAASALARVQVVDQAVVAAGVATLDKRPPEAPEQAGKATTEEATEDSPERVRIRLEVVVEQEVREAMRLHMAPPEQRVLARLLQLREAA